MDTHAGLLQRINDYHAYQVQQLENHPEYGLNGDIRISTLTKILSAMTGYQLALIHELFALRDRGWWDHFFGDRVDQHDIELRTSAYNQVCLLGFFQGVFMSLESSFRSISVTIDPDANNSGQGEFCNIYMFVFSRLNLRQYIPLFDILRLLRNTVHNNGLFLPANRRDRTITFDGIDYDFTVDELAPYLNQVDNSNLYYFLDQILICLKELFSDPTILAFPQIRERVR